MHDVSHSNLEDTPSTSVAVGNIDSREVVPGELPAALMACQEQSLERQSRTLTHLNLCAAGVGAVISGDFFGWQASLVGGFGSSLVTLCIATALYLLLAASVAEVAAIIPRGAGPCTFAQVCFGRRAAFVAGTAEVVKCLAVVCTTSVALSDYLAEIVGISDSLAPAWWVVGIGMFTLTSMTGQNLSTSVQLAATCISMLLLLVFFVGAVIVGTSFTDNAIGKGRSLWDTMSFMGVMKSWFFSLWFFLGIEEVPLATEVTINPERNVPLGLMMSFATMAVLAFLNFFISTSIPLGAEGMAKTTYPLLEGYVYVFGDKPTTRHCCLILVIGLLASMHLFIFATGQLIMQMAKSGHFPRFLGSTLAADTPVAALAACAIACWTLLFVLHGLLGVGAEDMGFVFIAMCLLCALLSYLMQLACFIHLRGCGRRSEISNDSSAVTAVSGFRSPFGVPGALVCMALCLGSLASIAVGAVTETMYGYGAALAAGMLCSAVFANEIAMHNASPSLLGERC
eukprot:TRINITY_DN43496_c0_g1_i1.p1 TRINITY_DN43496_c0_g1~~TRINITY_DN43496_c0_g1_i1.p1  ORF type:complete len:527 (+),score=70.79 TRINITY_DN43496_c0_g1_i1:47-1582(+)